MSSFDSFVDQIGLSASIAIDHPQQESIVQSAFSMKENGFAMEECKALLRYKVPKLAPDGLSCSITKELEENPFDLAREVFQINLDDVKEQDLSAVIGNKALRIWHLNKVVDLLLQKIPIDWFGIYRLINYNGKPALVKEAYRGEHSRAIFPVNSAFIEISNNSWVAKNGLARVIQDVSKYEGPYYECSNKVQSELCAPILHNGQVIGIIDAESWQQNFFTPEKLATILRVCFELGNINLGVN